MKIQAKPYLIVLLAACLLGVAHTASAQLVSVTSPGNGNFSTGAGIPNLGTFIVTNNTSLQILVSGVTIGVSNPSAFSTMTLTGTVNGKTQAVNISPISTSNNPSFSFSAILPGGTASFILSGTATSTLPSPSPGATATSSSVILDTGGASLGVWPRGVGQPPLWLLTLLMVGLLIAGGKLQRRHLVVLALGVIMAATQLGCGNVSLFGNGSSGLTSRQSVNALAISSGSVAPGNLPLALGTITVGSGSSSSSSNTIL